jgi:hypothetical protein
MTEHDGGNMSEDKSTALDSANAEAEAQRAAQLWATLTNREKAITIAYVEHKMSWKTCVRAFDLGSKENLFRLLNEVSEKLGGGDLRRLACGHK